MNLTKSGNGQGQGFIGIFLGFITAHFCIMAIHARIVPQSAESPKKLHISYANGNSEKDLPVCGPNAVCNRIQTYTGSVRVSRLCRCGSILQKTKPKIQQEDQCSTSADEIDGKTVMDQNQFFKVCQPISLLPVCELFRDTTYTITTYPAQNRTQQNIRCRCPEQSTTYILKWTQKHQAPNHKIIYHYACSPPTYLKCGNEEPCALFVMSGENIHRQSACSCGQGKTCPTRITQPTVKLLTVDENAGATTYGAFCFV